MLFINKRDVSGVQQGDLFIKEPRKSGGGGTTVGGVARDFIRRRDVKFFFDNAKNSTTFCRVSEKVIHGYYIEQHAEDVWIKNAMFFFFFFYVLRILSP